MTILKPTNSPKLICAISYVYLPEVLTAKKVGDVSIVVALKGINQWKPIYSTPGTITYNEKQTRTPEGILYAKELSIIYPDVNPAVSGSFAQLENSPCLVRFAFADGTYMLIGDLRYPVILSLDFKSDSKSVFTAVFLNKSPERALFYYPTVESVQLPPLD